MWEDLLLVCRFVRLIIWIVFTVLATAHAAAAWDEIARLPSTDSPPAVPPAQVYPEMGEAHVSWPRLTFHEDAADFLRLDPMDAANWGFQLLPDGVIYPAYLAGVKESRLAVQIISEEQDGWLLDATIGGRVGLFRFGTYSAIRPEGFQVDAEGAAHVRLDIPDDVDVRSVDFRAGLPITWGWGRNRTKFAYYHLSSHTGDEYLIKHPGHRRLNFARDTLVLGHSIYVTDDWRIYAEAGWAFWSDVAEEWEFQFGVDFAPSLPTGMYGAPFFAINGHLREEVDFGGNVTVQVGWAWRGDLTGQLLRIGLHYFNGKSNQFSFFDDFEQQLGAGVWYDY